MIGTLINTGTVALGGTAGLLVGGRLPERVRTIVIQGLGLATMLVGLKDAWRTQNLLILLTAIALGGLLGEAIGVQAGLDALGRRVEALADPARRRRTAATSLDGETADHSFSRGFVTASLVFCVGPMTILGAFQDGLTGDYRTLAVKSLLDGFSSFVFASSLGIGVPASALFVLFYQGALTLGARLLQPLLSEAMITEMTAVGGLLVLALGLVLLEIKPLRVASFLPALVVAPLLVAVIGWLGQFF